MRSNCRINSSVALAAVALLLVCSCSARTSATSSGHDAPGAAGGSAGIALLRTPAERRFGLAPKPDDDVTYQKDVVLLPEGADAIVSASNSGATVVLKAGARGIEAVTKGKVLFATGRVVGRVAGVRRVAKGVEVALAPVTLTDVISDADLSYDQPVDPSSMLVYEGQNLGGRSTRSQDLPDVPDDSKVVKTTDASGKPVEAEAQGDGGATGTGGESSSPARGTGARRVSHPVSYHVEPDEETGATTSTLPAAAGAGSGEGSETSRGDGAEADGGGGAAGTGSASDHDAPSSNPGGGGGAEAGAPLAAPRAFPGKPARISGFRLTPVGSGGIGVKLTYDKGGTKLLATVKLKLRSPVVHAGIVIVHGKLRSASLSITGAAGILAQFDAGTENGINGNIHEFVDVPFDITVPLGGAVPLSMTWRQTFILDTAFSARHGTLSAKGDYTFTGGLGFKYRSGSFSVNAPSDAKSDTSMVENLDGVSVGVSGLVLAYRARAIIGFGAFGFTSGLELTTTASWGVSKASDIGGIPCRRVDITLDGTAGVGWSIPRPLAAVINFFLQVFDTRIPSSGGLRSSPVVIAKGTGILPNVSACGGGSGGGG